MLCHQCGSPVSSDESTCNNCGANLERASRKLELRTDGLRRMTQQMRAVDAGGRFFPPNEVISDRFELGERIGAGPFGEVYRAVDELIDAEVALKVFDPKLIEDPRHQEQFLRTARVARTMTQANVVRIHGSGVHKDHPWVSMQALEGLSLHKVLQMRRAKGETFSLAEIEPIVGQITLAIQHVNREFPCGNLKPHNIVFLPELLKITDHYLHAAIDAEMFAQRLADSVYLAPELHTPTDEVDARCDVYSLGMIIGQMSFGADYTPGSEQSGVSDMAAIDALCRRATAFDPAERYSSVEALSEDFATLVDTGSLLHARAGGGPSGLAEVSEPPPPPQSSADLLNEETPDDIGEPLEDDIATREYQRDGDGGELGDLLETNEVRRDELPPPPRDDAAGSSEEATATAVRPGPSGDKSSSRQDRHSDGMSTPLVALVVVALIVLAGGVYYFGAPKQAKHVEIGDSNNDAAEASTPTAVAADDDSEAEGDEQPEPNAELVAATEQAGQTLLAAHGAADTALAEAAKEQEEGEEDDGGDDSDGEQDEAAAESGSAASGARSSRGSGSRSDGSASASASAKEAPATGTDCKSGMVLVRSRNGNYCIDAYEYPGRGAMPKTHVSWFEAKQLCESKGKRLCELSEWRGACGSKYPYGRSWDPDRCNTVDEDEFDRELAAAGSLKSCRSRSGAYDMVGNVHEWVAEQRIAGGGFDSGPDVASCRYSSAKAAGSSGGNIGFRCCDRAR